MKINHRDVSYRSVIEIYTKIASIIERPIEIQFRRKRKSDKQTSNCGTTDTNAVTAASGNVGFILQQHISNSVINNLGDDKYENIISIASINVEHQREHNKNSSSSNSGSDDDDDDYDDDDADADDDDEDNDNDDDSSYIIPDDNASIDSCMPSKNKKRKRKSTLPNNDNNHPIASIDVPGAEENSINTSTSTSNSNSGFNDNHNNKNTNNSNDEDVGEGLSNYYDSEEGGVWV
jgi:hypothetical protein